jgi:hypothetical protein
MQMEGVVLLVQEGRFMLETKQGDSHLFILSHKAACEPQQLLAANRKTVRVTGSAATELIGYVAYTVEVLEDTDV